ncbi:CPBP family intramembrane glutamic endopeptidase [Runella sp. SP2]|uniref:CPBP family intramembrane glutamic endopeptidase n=1 Tax=Runella sp. SP2 TaxID=2268026 RepID=UPI000F0838DA|nr:CPBP family intramembrane glutamic endopeptidase [Runella sp. SP2]AYQ34071.1 CPBP family intramembrane metalloprotease [Runella sp. SP2]
MLLFGLVLLGSSLGNLLAMAAIMALSMTHGGLGLEDIAQMLQKPETYPHSWWYLMLIQAVSHSFTFLIPSVIYWRWSEQHRVEDFVRRPLPSFLLLGVACLAVLAFMPLNSLIIEWNNSVHLPQGLFRVESWMRRKEQELATMTQFLTEFKSLTKLLVAMTVMAIIPAIGEEVLFRGIIQRKIFHKIGDMHISIWLTAAIFSATHLQFLGFIPRMLLGAMFGYMYAWSRNLWTPIFAHFVNNAATLLMVYLSNQQLISMNVENPESTISWTGALVSLVLTAGLLLNLKMISHRRVAQL